MSGIYVGFSPDENPKAPRVYDGENHLVTVGPPGSGKSLGLIVPNLALLDRSVLVIDPKGELARITARHRQKFGRVVILNPFGEQVDKRPDLKSDGFNPLAVLDPDSAHFVDDATTLAEGLVKIQGHDPHWSEGGQDFVAALIMHLRRVYGAAATLHHLRHLLCEARGWDKAKGQPTGINLTIAEMMASDFGPIVNKASRFEADSNEMASILSTARSQTRFLDSLPIVQDLSGGAGFDFADMRKETITVYLILPARELHTHANWLRLVIAAALRALTREQHARGQKPVTLILDEFAQLGHLSTIENAMSMARGYGVQLWPFLQDLTQLQYIYGDLWENFLGTAGFQMFFTPRTLMTAKYLSERCGSHEKMVESRQKDELGNIKGLSASVVVEPLYRPEYFFGMKRPAVTCFTEYEGDAIFLDAPHYSDSRLMWCQELDT